MLNLSAVNDNKDVATKEYVDGKAAVPTNHASSATTYGVGTASNYGHVKLSASTSSTSGESNGIAATPSAVKAAYDLANGKANASHTHSTQQLYYPNSLQGMNDVVLRTMVDTTRANRLAFLPADQIIIEQTTDGGTTWIDAGITDANKVGLFSQTRPAINLPRVSGTTRSNLCGLRITITAMKYTVPSGTAETAKYSYWKSANVTAQERYANLDGMYFWIGSNGDQISVKVERATGANPDTWVSAFNDTSFGMTGWSGNDFIKFSANTFGGGTTQTGNYWNWRITLMTKYANGTSAYSNTAQQIFEIRGYGTTWWGGTNNLMKNDHLYTWDYQLNATFPKQLTATQFNGALNGTATTATNVSGAAASSNTTARHIWFSDSATETKRAYSDSCTYVASTNTISANISGNAATATSATSATTATNATNADKVNNLTVQTAVPANAVFTDTKVKQTSKTSGTYPLMLTGATSPTSGNAAEANYHTNVKVDTSAGNLQATKFNGLTLTAASTGFTIAGGTTSKTLTVNNTYTLAAACAKGVDTSISSGSTSTNLPTTAAVASYVSSQAGSDTKATQTGTNTSGNYPLLFKNTANTTDETAAVRYGNTSGKLVTVNPSSGNINASSFNGITITDDGADGIFIASAEGSIVVEGGNDFTLGPACAKDVGTVTSGNTGLVTGGDVYTAIQNAGGGGGRVATYYTTCSTAAGTAAKVITISGYTPQAGDVLTVYFSTANTANAPTINLNSTGAKAIYIGSAAASATNQLLWSAGDTLMFVYSGSYWYFVSRAKGDTFTTLYNNTTGTNGTVTLSSSAANFDHMRIYFKKSSGQNGCGSVDVYSPNGKYVNLTIFEPDSGSAYLWFASRTVYINGTSISTYGSAVGGAIGASTSCGSNTELNIIRVEAWK